MRAPTRSLYTLWLVCTLASPSAAQERRDSTLPSAPRVHRDLAYVAGGHERQKLDLFLPEKADVPIPVIVWIYGGAWRTGSKDANPLLSFVVSFVNNGFAVASINYRLSQHAIFPAQFEDVRRAVEWLRANAGPFGLDPDRIAAWGNSSGGHFAALLGTTSGVPLATNTDRFTRVKAVVDFFGPTDFLQMDDHRLQDGLVHNSPDSPESQLIGGSIQTNREKAMRANPITYVTPDDAPFLILHGDVDKLVPHHQSQLLFDALTKSGVPATFRTLEGAGHGGPAFTTEKVRQLVLDFLNVHLKPSRY